jgi:hypothetical protein
MALAGRCFRVALAVTLAGCTPPAFPREFVSLDLTRAPVPMMMSRVKRAPPPGPPRFANEAPPPPPSLEPDTIFTYENGRMSVRSRFGASDQVLRRIRGGTGWAQVGELVFTARDEAWLSGGSETQRELQIPVVGRR